MSDMLTGSTTPVISVSVPAKINLHLGVGDARDDGFHELTTVYQAISLYDTVTVKRSLEPGITLTVSGEGADALPTDDDNLAVRAAKLVAIYGHVDPAIDIHLEKNIPIAGGLAGGSADAAATLVACARLWQVDMRSDELDQLAAGLGSDVPFCLRGGVAIGTGRGEELDYSINTQGTYYWVVATSDGHISTPECYREVDRLRDANIGRYSKEIQPLRHALESGLPATELAPLLINDMEVAAISLRPELSSLMHGGLEDGAVAAHVSGSGPTVLFLARDAEDAQTLAKQIRQRPIAKDVHIAHGPVAGPLAAS